MQCARAQVEECAAVERNVEEHCAPLAHAEHAVHCVVWRGGDSWVCIRSRARACDGEILPAQWELSLLVFMQQTQVGREDKRVIRA